MRGFRSLLWISGRQGAKSVLLVACMSFLLVNSGCAGLSQTTHGGGGTPLAISNVAAANVTVTGVAISWQTNASANSQLEYGTTSSYGSTTPLDATMVLNHQETLANLKPASLYHYRVHSTNATNGTAVSGDLTFTTVADTTAPTVSITSPAASGQCNACRDSDRYGDCHRRCRRHERAVQGGQRQHRSCNHCSTVQLCPEHDCLVRWKSHSDGSGNRYLCEYGHEHGGSDKN